MLSIFICDLTAKNHGLNVGRWIALPMKKDELRAEIYKILEESEEVSPWDELHEEWEIEDWEWDENVPKMFELDIDDNVFSINDDIALIENSVLPDEYKIISFLIDEGYDLKEATHKVKTMEMDVYENSTLEDVARDLFDNYFGLETDDNITRYLDFKEWGDDLLLDDYHQVGNDVFRI